MRMSRQPVVTCYDQQGILLEQRSAEKHLTLDEAAYDPRIPMNKCECAGFGPGIVIVTKTGRRVSVVVYVREARTTAECVFICILFRRCIRVRPTNERYAHVRT